MSSSTFATPVQPTESDVSTELASVGSKSGYEVALYVVGENSFIGPLGAHRGRSQTVHANGPGGLEDEVAR